MHRIHSGLTIAVIIKPDSLWKLKEYLGKINCEQKALCQQLDKCTSLLFASCSIIPEQKYEKEVLPATFVFATTCSGRRSVHLRELVKIWRTHLVELFQHCEGFPINHLVKDADLVYLMKRHSLRHAFNSRYNCISKIQLRNDNSLVRNLQDYIDIMQLKPGFNQLNAKETRNLIQKQAQNLRYKYTDLPKTYFLNFYEFYRVNRTIAIQWLLFVGFYCFMIFYRGCVSCVLSILFSSIVALVITLLVVAGIITREKHLTAARPETIRIRELAQTQLSPVINEMIASGPLKPGRLRRHFYYYSLAIVGFVREPFMTVPTVSSIRWVSVNNKRRLLFLSCYHNTTDFYVREFLTGNTPLGVNFIFTNGQGFPDAQYLFRQGITADPEGYMNVIHAFQGITDFWYAHDPDLTVDIINKNRKIRLGLFGKMNESQSKKWLELF